MDHCPTIFMIDLLNNVTSMHSNVGVVLPVCRGVRRVVGRLCAPNGSTHTPVSSVTSFTRENEDNAFPLAIL